MQTAYLVIGFLSLLFVVMLIVGIRILLDEKAIHAQRVEAVVRERCAKLCDKMAWIMESGGGEIKPGARLRQVARYIREGEDRVVHD